MRALPPSEVAMDHAGSVWRSGAKSPPYPGLTHALTVWTSRRTHRSPCSTRKC
ncbi:unnamed protein product [Coregonus sp. 'balchen']|nr:unnamed protein product [Coregonus sp. 'balchen']